MDDDVQSSWGHAESARNRFAGLFFEDAQTDGLSVARMDTGKRRLDACPCRLPFPKLVESQIGLWQRLRSIELACQVIDLPKDDAPTRAEVVERDAQSHRSQPRPEAAALPTKLIEAFDDARVYLRKRVLSGRLGTQSRQEHAAVKRGPVVREQSSHRVAVTRLCA